jgi:hypothetical protein
LLNRSEPDRPPSNRAQTRCFRPKTHRPPSCSVVSRSAVCRPDHCTIRCTVDQLRCVAAKPLTASIDRYLGGREASSQTGATLCDRRLGPVKVICSFDVGDRSALLRPHVGRVLACTRTDGNDHETLRTALTALGLRLAPRLRRCHANSPAPIHDRSLSRFKLHSLTVSAERNSRGIRFVGIRLLRVFAARSRGAVPSIRRTAASAVRRPGLTSRASALASKQPRAVSGA